MLHYCTFESVKDTVPKPLSVGSFRDLVEGFSPASPFGMHTPAPYKEAVPLFSVVTFKEGTRQRKASALTYVNAAVFDLDDAPAGSLERIHDRLVADKINHAIRSSYSDKGPLAASRRFRVVIELDRPLPVADWADLWDRLDAKYMERLSDGQCKDANRIYYVPSFPGHGGVQPQSFVFLDGEPLSSGRALAEPRQIPALPKTDTTRCTGEMLKDLAVRLRRRKDPSDGHALELVVQGNPFAESGTRDLTLFRVCCRIAEAFPDVIPATVVPFFQASLSLMARRDPTDPLTEENVLDKLVRAKASAAQTMASQQAAAEESIRGAIRRAFMTVGIMDRYHPYTPEEVQWMAEEMLCCAPEDLHRHLCVVVESSCWLWVYDRYIGPYPLRTMPHVARTLLAPSTTVGFTPEIEGAQGPKPITADQMLSRFSTIAAGLSYSALSERSSYSHSAQQLVLAACPRRRDLTAKWHPDIDGWLRAMSGSKYEELVEWLSAFAEWGRPLKVGLFIGKGGTGKSLLVAGLSSIFQASTAASLGEVMGNQGFNADLKYTLVCAAEESAPKDLRGEARTAELRDFISLRNHTIRIKYQPNATLLGCARVIMTSNNDGMFAGTHDLTLDDIEAIQERFFMLPCLPDAKAFLDTIDTDTKELWATRAIAEHAMFLHTCFADYVDTSRRFLGPPASHDFTDRMLIQSGSRSTILHWLMNFLESPQQAPNRRMFTYSAEEEVLFVNSGAILNSWGVYAPAGVPCPTARRLGTDLQSLANTTRRSLRDGTRRYWAYPIDVAKISAWAERYGMGVQEEIMKSLGGLGRASETMI